MRTLWEATTAIDGLNVGGLLVNTLLWLGPAIIALVVGFRPLGGRVDQWAEARDVPLTAETRPWVTRHLTRARRWRTVGFALGWSSAYVELWIVRSAHEAPEIVPGWFPVAGYLAGALVAELWAAFRTQPSGAAALTTRRIERYLPTEARRWTWLTAGASVALVPLYAVVPLREDPWVIGLERFALQTMVILALLAANEVVPRLIVRRRQVFHSPELLRADDALRSWSAHAVTGTFLACMLGALSVQTGELRWAEAKLVQWVAYPTSFGLMIIGYLAFRYLSSYDWRWRVPPGPSPSPSPSTPST